MNVKTGGHRAVSISPKGQGCSAIKEIVGKRFLSKDAPLLPLPECDNRDNCDCRYSHWDDRRQEDDRRSPVGGMSAQMRDGDERRARQDRREN
jgi:hypothetical protein